ncbi:TPA: hypothetical protein ACOFEF_001349 [Stenotrophomonas maltophilia]|uniref:hypothetical protein n=1 Tax=Stenotrophomonas maltophilia TaxID=40324 RepID=UPI00066BD24A|nr:hypothetical protein [Stenotrophomonas maltophilia]MBH1676426.1 hypothetical protein [Stenotrophomonas maltophilia]MDZ5780310.1 hypothetical protein [Stenotrophomonas maltophilia]HDS1622896.1 hypothetical protein [Stenotrophomonas maltophilia]HEL3198992.1 hypothetical protein [Stenotrophomonas maltophilia]HEL3212735.1 hypothetical protein [Stenotrophomonas maltophilia]
MKKTVQQPAPESIGQTPDAHSEIPDTREPADTRYDWLREEWDRSTLPKSVAHRMEKVDRTIQAVMGLQRVLMRDHRGRSLQAADPQSIRHDGLDEYEIEAMHDAVHLLVYTAADEMEYMRTNRNQFWSGMRDWV